MSTPVQLYVYDLSNGLARQMSQQLTGRQIDGIWHTSVVVFGREIFYGQGIAITAPGQSHHGRPMTIVDMGETALDEETFEEYLSEIKHQYTADKYHLLDFNCNSFTNDCVGFLTGGSIPSWIKDLPSDFLSTPFGAALRPTIDNMFRRPTPGAPIMPAPSPRDPQVTSSLLQAVASRAVGPSSPGYLPTPAPTPTSPQSPLPASASVAASLQVCSNLPSFNSLLSAHKAVAVFFTSQTCPPCKMVEPVFEELARDKASIGVAFVKVDLGVGLSSDVARKWNVRATPTFIFFLDGKKMHELKGANSSELRTQVDLLIYQAFPPHPHVALDLPAIRALSLDPILFAQVPVLDTVHAKLVSFVDTAPPSSFDSEQKIAIKEKLHAAIIPFLKARFVARTPSNSAAVRILCTEWTNVTATLAKGLPVAELFPLVDLWRLGVLDENVSTWCAASASASAVNTSSPIRVLLNMAISALDITTATPMVRNFFLTILRLLSNSFSTIALARSLLDSKASLTLGEASPRQELTTLLVTTLLHTDAAVRTAAASLAFNVAAHCQRPLVEAQRGGRRGDSVMGDGAEGDWEVEIVSAVVEALQRETQSEDVVHRLTGSLAYFLHLSPYYETQSKSLLEVLQTRNVLLSKLRGGRDGFGEQGVSKKDVRKLVEEVARKLCP